MDKLINLHLISETSGETLISIAKTVRAQHAQVRTVEHRYPNVQGRQQLDSVLKDVQAAPGIVIYALDNRELAAALEQSCKRLNITSIVAPKSDESPGTDRRVAERLQTRVAKLDAETLKQTTGPSKWLRAVVLSVLAVFLVWAVGAKSITAYLADERPEAVIEEPFVSPTALVNEASAKLKAVGGAGKSDDVSSRDNGTEVSLDHKGQSGNQDIGSQMNSKAEPLADSDEKASTSYAEIRASLESALRKDPLNARSFTLLGQIAANEEDMEEKHRFMKASARRSLHESSAVYWTMRKSYEDENYTAAIDYADALLRSRTDAERDVIPILAKISETERGGDQLKKVLATNPPWRSAFFKRFPQYVLDPLTPLNISLALKSSAFPPKMSDLQSYLALLVSKGFLEFAYYAWLQLLPPEQLSTVGLLFNGDFEAEPLGVPFDWTFDTGSSVGINIAGSPDKDGTRALSLSFWGGRVSKVNVSQLVMLPPGQYRFDGQYIADIVSQRGLQWRVSCHDQEGSPLAESDALLQGSGTEWQDFSFSFTVPKADCPAQLVKLFFNARWASEQFISGLVWYDNLRIDKIPEEINSK